MPIPDSQRALEQAAKAMRTDLAQARFVDPQLFDSEDARITAKLTIDAYLAALGGLGRERDGEKERYREALETVLADLEGELGVGGRIPTDVDAIRRVLGSPGSGQAEEETDG